MIKIDYRLNAEKLIAYFDKVEKLIGTPIALEKYNKRCNYFFKTIEKRDLVLYGQIKRQTDYICGLQHAYPKLINSVRHYAHLETALTLDTEVMVKIISHVKKYFVKDGLIKLNHEAITQGLKNSELTSYGDLRKRRGRLKAKGGTFYKIISKPILYDCLHALFAEFIEIYAKFVSQKINQWIVDETGVRVCPYCNLAYVYNREKHATAQLDHFLNKSEYPMFALSFYNLVPSCPACNHIKSDSDGEMASPYEKDVFSDVVINWYPKQSSKSLHGKWELTEIENNIEIVIETGNNQVQNNVQNMALETAYNKHLDYASEVLLKTQTYMNSESQALIKKTFQDMGITNEDIERYYFGGYLEAEALHKRPLSKMTHDFVSDYKASSKKYDDFLK